MPYLEIAGWLGAFFTLGAYSMRNMLSLRCIAVAANVAFITYGALTPVYPMLALHIALLPLNLYRLSEILIGLKRIRRAAKEDDPIAALKPFLKPTDFSDGDVIFRQGDSPSHVYYLERGEIALPELEETLSAGTIFGEMAYFTRSNARTTSAVCKGDCSVMKIDEKSFMAVYHQHPEFGHFLIRLMAQRLIAGARKNPALYEEFAEKAERQAS